MSEAVRLTSTDVPGMLALLGDRAGERKLRLFACACARRIWNLLDPSAPAARDAVVTAERWADGEAGEPEVAEARRAVRAAVRSRRQRTIRQKALIETGSEERADARMHAWYSAWTAAAHTLQPRAAEAARLAATAARDAVSNVWGAPEDAVTNEGAQQAILLHDVIGSPTATVRLDAKWLTSDVQSLARTIYDQRSYRRLPYLADALEEAGCTDQVVLDHLRGPGPHVRGCFAVDALTGRS
jgi:hypothetical protein